MRIDRTFIFHTNKSAGFNAGVAIKVSNGVAAGVTLGGNYVVRVTAMVMRKPMWQAMWGMRIAKRPSMRGAM
ncbi:hypothetical protein BKK51_01845 [Rodentibacter trehalosifermentans]|uniref:Uncharacterized protein n=1 Tax=Rodentibacter trehalosifermentans TaxID=1908263 RepID=A0A1V3IXE0_9PAST|nr:hypothetical protein [Rodentibacter trehalosifermentans]OOF46643.1 hypothetical protein BKK51_01845 [Rodentibacter trehalosifermentans]